MNSSIRSVAQHKPVDSQEQFCGLFPPTLGNQRGWFLSSSIRTASSPACIASTRRPAPRRKAVDVATGYCGLSLPTPLRRIDIVAADNQRLLAGSGAAHQRCAGRPGFVNPTPDHIADAPTQRSGNRITRLIDPEKTTPTIVRPNGTGMHARAGPF